MYLQTKTLAIVLSDANVLLIYAYANTKPIVPIRIVAYVLTFVKCQIPSDAIFHSFEYVLLLLAISRHSTKVFAFDCIYKIIFCIPIKVFRCFQTKILITRKT